MSEMFFINKRDIDFLVKFYRDSKKQFRAASASMLNHFAFGTKKAASAVIGGTMIVRSEKFVNSRLRVRMANKKASIGRQVSIAASIRSPRFSGWIEQQTGAKAPKDRTFSLAGRRGSRRRKALQKARLKKSNTFKTPDEFKGRDSHNRVVAMLGALSDERYKEPFKVYGHASMTSGIYKFKGRKLTMLQKFSANAQPNRLPWMDLARSRYFRGVNMQRLWGRTISYVLKVNK